MEDKLYIFLPVEIIHRELDYKIEISRRMANNGFKVMIGNPSFIHDELKYRNYKGILLEKGLNPTPEYYKTLQKKGIYVYDLSDEGLGKNVYSMHYKPCIDALESMRKIFLWGSEQKKILSSQCQSETVKAKMHVVGNPAFDLSTPKYKLMHDALRDDDLPNSYILVNMNFSAVMGLSIEEVCESCKNMSPETYDLIVKEYALEDKIFPIFLSWLDSIFKAFPEEKFIIRPHPTELESKYHSIFDKYDNVVISKKGNVNYVIASAKLVLHKDCMTAIQSYLAGVPVISLGGDSLYSKYVSWPLAFSHLPHDIDHAIQLIKMILNPDAILPNLPGSQVKKIQDILKNNFLKIGDSTNLLVDSIKKDSIDLVKNFSSYKLINKRSFILKIKLFIRNFLSKMFITNVQSDSNTMSVVNKKMILERLSLFDKINHNVSEWKVEKLFSGTFSIERV